MPIMIIGGLLFLVLIGRYLPPEIAQYLIIGVLVGFLAVAGANDFIQQYIPKNFLHFGAVFRNAEGRAGKEQQVFLAPDSDNLTIEHFKAENFDIDAVDDNGQKIMKDGKEVKKTVQNGQLFLLRPHLPITIGPFKGVKSFLVDSPRNFDESFKLGPRPKVAMYNDSEIYTDHPFSDEATFYILGVPHTHLGDVIPVVQLVEAGGRWDDWKEGDGKADGDGCKWTACGATGLKAINASVALKSKMLVQEQGKVTVLDSEVEGFQNQSIDIHKSVVRTVDALHTAEGTIDNVHKYLHQNRENYLYFIVAILGIVLVGGYLNSNQSAWAWVNYYATMYWWLILLVVGGLLVFWWTRRKR